MEEDTAAQGLFSYFIEDKERLRFRDRMVNKPLMDPRTELLFAEGSKFDAAFDTEFGPKALSVLTSMEVKTLEARMDYSLYK